MKHTSKDMPLVSVIVPTYNSTTTLAKCLQSITDQSYPNIELLVVDNNSKDDTKDVAKLFTPHVYNRGPERSAQRNYGVNTAKGEHVFIIDSDMELSPKVVADCVKKLKDKAVSAVIIPEESFGTGFWAQCKKLERSYYVGISWMEAARAFRKTAYQAVGGYDETMISGEDWDLSQRVESQGSIDRVNAFIYHNEGNLKLIATLKKKYYYAQKFASYRSITEHSNVSMQTGPLTRYKLFFSKPGQLFTNPALGVGMLFMKTAEFGVGAVALLLSKNSKNHEVISSK